MLSGAHAGLVLNLARRRALSVLPPKTNVRAAESALKGEEMFPRQKDQGGVNQTRI
jgi:hypothetical protein